MRRIAIFNQKGGVAKTTTAVNLGAALAKHEKKVCIVDLDSQVNTCTYLGFKKDKLLEMKTIYECLTEELPISEAIVPTNYEFLDLVPANKKMANIEQMLTAYPGCETLLKESIESSLGKLDYDYMIFDCPPSLENVSLNALTAAKEIIVPVEGAFALEGLNELMKTVRLVKKRLNPDLEVLGALLTKYTATNLSTSIYAELATVFGDKVFENVIRNSVKVGESQSHSKPIIYYDSKCTSSEDYMALAKEVISGETEQ